MTSEQVAMAREWLMDCEWADVTPEEISDMPDDVIVRAVAQHFEGGAAGFLATYED